jgi:thiol:disulfide interchange protein DsbD
METFKHLMGFTLLGAAIWLYSVLLSQLTPSGATWFLGFLLVLALAAWMTHRFGGLMETNRRRAVIHIVALSLVVASGIIMIDFTPKAKVSAQPMALDAPILTPEGKINWVPYSEATLKKSASKARPIFADFTADWCANCKANEKIFLETDPVRKTLQKTGIMPMMGDYTNEDEEITLALRRLGRTAVPAYVIYMPDGTFDLMPEVITTEMVVERLNAASAKYPPANFK